MNRSVVEFGFEGVTLIATRHGPEGQPHPTACVLLNPGPAPRAGNSDLYVEIAERLARDGVQCFRVDLPGLGDSGGDAYATIDAYWHAVQQGVNDRAVAAVVASVRERFGAQRVVLGGLCAGAISAVRACAASPGGVAGLLLLEPNFRRSAETGPAARADEGSGAPARGRVPRWRKALDLNSWLYLLTGERSIARPFRPLRPVLYRLLTRRVGHALPNDCNRELVLSWNRAHALSIPSLVACAEGQLSDRYVTRILQTSPGGAPVHRCGLVGTNHILTAGNGRRDAAGAVAAWVANLHAEGARAGAPRAASGQGLRSVPA